MTQSIDYLVALAESSWMFRDSDRIFGEAIDSSLSEAVTNGETANASLWMQEAQKGVCLKALECMENLAAVDKALEDWRQIASCYQSKYEYRRYLARLGRVAVLHDEEAFSYRMQERAAARLEKERRAKLSPAQLSKVDSLRRKLAELDRQIVLLVEWEKVLWG
jgi:hypothetical protein